MPGMAIALWMGVCLNSCTPERPHAASTIFGQEDSAEDSVEVYDLEQIQQAGTLIGITLSGPDTYYEYRGQGFGVQYRLAEEFAREMGVKLQMEIAPDTATLIHKLMDGEADFVALESGSHKRWRTRDNTPQLTQAINEWWDNDRKLRLTQVATEKKTVRRKMHPLMSDRAHGIISPYDDLFIKASSTAGWDWRLLAALSYQESGFDPQAQSWAGAKGLMQIMPATAATMGIAADQLMEPAINIRAGATYLRQLQRSFSDIKDTRERTAFVLAAYNGGSLHIRDAMALTRKHGGNEQLWAHVAPYVLKLQEEAFYRDPVVKNGYMRGSETEAYVRQIMDRWADYRGSARAHSAGSKPTPARRNMKNGSFQSKVKGAEHYLDSI